MVSPRGLVVEYEICLLSNSLVLWSMIVPLADTGI